jgi:hypothetical protein
MLIAEARATKKVQVRKHIMDMPCGIYLWPVDLLPVLERGIHGHGIAQE